MLRRVFLFLFLFFLCVNSFTYSLFSHAELTFAQEFSHNFLAQNMQDELSAENNNIPANPPPLFAEGERPHITVGYENGMGLIADYDSFNAKGYGYDLLIKLGQYAGVDFEFVEVEGSLIEAVQSGLVDIGGLYSHSAERAEEIYFGNVPVHTVQFSLSTKGENDYYYDDPSTINGKTVAVYEDNPAIALLDAYLAENNISVEYVYGDLQNFTELDTDFYLLPSIVRSITDFHSVLNLDLRYLYFFSSRENEELMHYLDEELRKLFIENASFQAYLHDKYRLFGNEFQNRSLTREEATLLEGQTFRVGYIDNHAPYQSSGLLGDPEGISVEFMNHLAEEYNFTIEYVPYNLDNNLNVNEDIDILLSLVGERDYISEFYNTSDPYYEIDLIIALQESFEENALLEEFEYGLPQNANVGMLNYIAFKYINFFNKFPTAQLVQFSSTNALFDAFKTQEIDALIATSLGGDSVASNVTNGKHQYSLNASLEMELQIAKDLGEEYLEIFNVIINKEPESTIDSIVVNQMAEYAPTFGTEQFIRNNLNYIITAAIVLAIMIIAFVLLIRYRSTIAVLAKDDVTPLHSLSHFTALVNEKLSKAKIGEYELILLDIDYFRMINTYYGIEKGTEVIITMADALTDAFKKDDVILARRIAEQFLIFKKTSTDKTIKEVVNAYIIPRITTIVGEGYSLYLSIGYCKNIAKDEKMNSMLDNASLAHNKAKKTHTTSFEEFTEQMRDEANKTLDIIYRMEHAIQNKEFKVHFQPKIDFQNLKIIGAEALCRWIPPIGDPVYPNDFIPIMEKNGFISQLEMYVFEEVCNILQKNKNVVDIPKIAINISPITLSKASLIKKFIEILKLYKVNPSRIEIEITESTIADFEKDLPTIIKILHKIGFTVAMDDFGVGNSSLNRLSIIEVDVLKLDKVFLDFHEDAPRGSMVVEQIINLAKQLDMKVVAEGIEGKNQGIWLKSIGCDMAQGYYFAKVLDENAFIKLLLENKQYTL